MRKSLKLGLSLLGVGGIISIIAVPTSISCGAKHNIWFEKENETGVIGTTRLIPYQTDKPTKSIVCESSNTDIFTVDNNKKEFTFVGEGEAFLTAYFEENPKIKATIKIHSYEFLSLDVSFSEKEIFFVDTQERFFVNVEPSTTPSRVIYTSSDPEVASVDENGIVKILSDGEAEIKVALAIDESKFKIFKINAFYNFTINYFINIENATQTGATLGEKTINIHSKHKKLYFSRQVWRNLFMYLRLEGFDTKYSGVWFFKFADNFVADEIYMDLSSDFNLYGYHPRFFKWFGESTKKITINISKALLGDENLLSFAEKRGIFANIDPEVTTTQTLKDITLVGKNDGNTKIGMDLQDPEANIKESEVLNKLSFKNFSFPESTKNVIIKLFGMGNKLFFD